MVKIILTSLGILFSNLSISQCVYNNIGDGRVSTISTMDGELTKLRLEKSVYGSSNCRISSNKWPSEDSAKIYLQDGKVIDFIKKIDGVLVSTNDSSLENLSKSKIDSVEFFGQVSSSFKMKEEYSQDIHQKANCAWNYNFITTISDYNPYNRPVMAITPKNPTTSLKASDWFEKSANQKDIAMITWISGTLLSGIIYSSNANNSAGSKVDHILPYTILIGSTLTSLIFYFESNSSTREGAKIMKSNGF